MIALITEGMHEDGIRQLESAGITAVPISLPHNPSDVGVLIVRSVFRVDQACLEKYPNVTLVAKLGTGLDNIDQALCQARGVQVINAPAMNAISTAEFAVSQILNIYKNSFEIYNRVQKRDFRRAQYFGHEMADKVAGVIGYGNVGRAIAERLAPFVEKIYIRDRQTQGNLQAEKLHFVDDQNTLLRNADIIVLCVSLHGNEHMVNQEFLSRLKDNVLLVNIARGGIVDEHALTVFLQSHPNAWYYCDVIDPEPDYTLPPDKQTYSSPLFNLDNVLYTPHIANLTDECQRRIALTIAKNIITICQEKKSS